MSATLIDQLQAELRRSNALLEAIQATVIDGISIVDQHRQIVFYNPQFCRVWGIPETTAQALDAQQLLQLIRAQMPQTEEFWSRVEFLYQHPDVVAQDEIILKDGRTLDRYSAPVRLPDGSTLGRIWYYRDITEHKQTDQALQASEAQYRDLVETANSIILRCDRTGKVRFINEYGQRFLGFSADELIGRSITETIVPQVETTGRDLQHIVTNYCEDPDQYSVQENENVCRNGDRVWMAWTNKPILDSDGNLTEILSIGTDATERKQAQIALQKSEAQLQAILNNANASIFVKDLQGRYTFANHALAKELNVQPEAIIGKTDYELLPFEFAQAYRANDRKALAAGTPIKLNETTPHQDGDSTFVSVKFPLFDLEGNAYATCGISTDISDRVRAEAILRDSELRYRSIFQNSQVGIGRVCFKNDGLFLGANQRCAEILGHRSAADLVDKRLVLEYCAHSGDRQQMIDQLEHQGEVRDYEAAMRRPDGSIVWTLISLKFNVDADCTDFVLTDISERKRLEEELRRSQQFLNTIIDNIPLAIFVKDVTHDFRYTLVNKNCEKILGFSTAAAIGCNDYERLTLERAAFHERQDLAVIERREILELPEQWIENDPGRVMVRGWKLPLFDNQGEVTHLLGIVEDITVRNQGEQALRLIMEGTAAVTGDEFFRSCVRSLVEVLGVRYAVVTEFADAAKTKLRTLANWTGDRFGENFEIPIKSAIHKDILAGETSYYSEAVRVLFPDEAKLRSINAESYLGVPLSTASGEILGHLAVIDVAPMKDDPKRELILKIFAARAAAELNREHADQALQTAKEAAETANHAKSAFLANMSHELRTPLNAILGFAQLMERDSNLTNRQRNALATINRSGEHLLNLINDVLEMSKIEAGRIVLNVAAFDLHQLLQLLKEMFQVRTQTKKLALEFEIDADLPRYILSDEGKLRQILINLLGNAVKFTEVGGVTLRARARSSDQSCTLQFEVADTGHGIALDQQDNLFEPFVQTDSCTGSKEGTGLGLAISRQFIHLMGGEFNFTSAIDHGSTFWFEIPGMLADAIALPIVCPQQRVVRLAQNQPTYRILVVDDRSENCDLLTQLLETVGFETRTAANGQEAIEQWHCWQPHLIWMDMRMPVMDGYEATRRIRQAQTQQQSSTKIIALTASAFEEQQASILAAGCDDFVYKPFRESIIFEKMTQHLGVQYCCAEVREDLTNAAPSSCRALDAASLEIMPSDWLADLRQAAFGVDGDRILQLIEQIPVEGQWLAEQLSDLMRRFCFDEILELLPDTKQNCRSSR